MIGRSILSYLPVNMANLLTAFGTIVVLTRLLEPEQFGIYAVAMITMQFFHMALFTWMEAAMVRFQARACLLYTSPSPRDQRGSRMPSSA